MSPTLLSTRLKQLIKCGVVELAGSKGNYTYNLTAAGQELRPVVELLGAWGHRWVRSDLNNGDLDAGLLMWDMRRSVDASMFPDRRVVVQFEYPDAPEGARNWWLVSEGGDIDLCLNDHGYDVDIVVTCTLKAMTEVWTCERTFNQAAAKGDIVVKGDQKLVNKLQDWLRSSALSKLGTIDSFPKFEW